jgi:histidinol-phosphate/aromatic aminotransferase/cobyric acid decarboxylase-like protein
MAAWGLPNHIRVSVARDSEMPRVIATLNEVLAG